MSRKTSKPETDRIAECIYVARDRLVMLDEDLARLYGTETRVLNQAVRRNRDRFPDDFLFELTMDEFKNLKSQTVTSSWGGRRKTPLAFTEQGVSMLATVLNTDEAAAISIQIIRAFTHLRELRGAAEGVRTSMDGIVDAQRTLFGDFYRALDKLRTEIKGQS